MNSTSLFSRIRQFAPLALILLSAIIAVASYLQTLDYPFVYDDVVYVPENAKLAGLHLSELWRLFVEPYNEFSEFLPLRDFSYWLDMTLFGLAPSVFRVHNILLYLLCLPLVYATTLELWRYFRQADTANAPMAAAAVTVLFALHPTLVEPVVWIGGRKDIQAAMFSLLALWLALRAKRKQALSAPYAAATLLVLLAAMLSKATAFAVAPLIAMLWTLFWFDIPKPERRRSMLLWPFASLLLAACVAKIFAAIITTRVPFYFGMEAVTRTLAIFGWLTRLALSPESRHVFYPVFEYPHLFVMVAIGGVALAGTVAAGISFLRKRSLEGFALIAFFLFCAPSLQFIPYEPPALVSDRFLALAVWPAILLIVAILWRVKPAARAVILFSIALPWCMQTVERPRDWRSFETTIDADLQAYPGCYMPAHYKIVDFQLRQEKYAEAISTANSITIPQFRDVMLNLIEADRAVYDLSTVDPRGAMSLLWDLGLSLKQPPALAQWDSPIKVLWEMSQITLASEWEFLIGRFPDDISVRYNYGLWLLSVPKYEYAAPQLQAAIESQHLPEYVRGNAFKNLGRALMNSGHIAEAEAPLRAALEQSPPDLQANCMLSDVYKQSGRLKEAAQTKALCHP
jgi:tetratricopeptide (TPR) repeat protein